MKLDSNRLAVAGDSVGGNMATVVALLAKERGGPKIHFQLLFYPVTDANFNTRSYQDFAEGPWLTKPAMEWFWNAYAPNLSDRKKHTVCPLLSTLDQLRDLPPTLLITDENDVLRDEGEAYAHQLMQAGVEVTVMRYLGTIHDLINSMNFEEKGSETDCPVHPHGKRPRRNSL
jgi:acetyl esterase